MQQPVKSVKQLVGAMIWSAAGWALGWHFSSASLPAALVAALVAGALGYHLGVHVCPVLVEGDVGHAYGQAGTQTGGVMATIPSALSGLKWIFSTQPGLAARFGLVVSVMLGGLIGALFGWVAGRLWAAGTEGNRLFPALALGAWWALLVAGFTWLAGL